MKRILHKCLIKLFEKAYGPSIYLKLASSLYSLPEKVEHQGDFVTDPREVLQGVLNSSVIPFHLYRIWPFWVYKQLNPQSSDFTSSGLPAFSLNTTHRNWTILSFPGINEQGIVDPTGLITPLPNGWSVDFWIHFEDRLYSPSRLTDIQQKMAQNNSVVQTNFALKQSLQIASEAFFTQDLHYQGYIFNKVRLRNTTNEPLSTSLFFAIRPYNPEGISPVRDIYYLSQQGFVIDNRLGVVLDQNPDNVVCLSFEDGDVSEHYKDWEMILQAHCPHGLASAFVEYKVKLDPYEEKAFTCKMPTTPVAPLLKLFQTHLPLPQKDVLLKKINGIKAFKWDEMFEKHTQSWDNQLNPLSELSVPDKQLTELFRTNQAQIQMFIGKDKVFTQGFSYQSAKIHEKVYVILALNNMGGSLLSEKLLHQTRYLQKNGPTRFLKAEEAGQLLFAIHNTYQFTQDPQFLEEYYPKLEAFVKKIKHFAKKWSPNQSFHDRIGKLLTGYTSQEEYLYGYFWALTGLRSAMQIAHSLNKMDRKDYFSDLFNSLMASLQMVLLYSMGPMSRSTFIPVSTKRLVDSGLVMSLVSVYPLNLISVHDERISKTIDLLEQFLVNNVLFNSIGYSGYSVFQNAQLAQLYILKEDKKVWDILNWMVKTASQTGTWPESIHPISFGGSGGDGHSGLASAEFLNLVMRLLSRSDDFGLHLCPFIPPEWLENEGLSLKKWATEFGTFTLSLKRIQTRIEFEFIPDFKTSPSEIRLYIPYEFASIYCNGQQVESEHRYIVLAQQPSKGWVELKDNV